MAVVVVGLNHRGVPLELLEKVTISSDNVPKALLELSGREHLNEVVLLSTCMRTEVYAETDRFHGAVADIRDALARHNFIAPEDFSDHLYTYYDGAAVEHLFKVAAGLDSAILGEGEVLGQVASAQVTARREGVVGPVLSALFRHATEVGKRARTETDIARGATSLPTAAVRMAVQLLGTFEGKSVLLLGAGAMGTSMAHVLSGVPGVNELVVVNRTIETADRLAAELGGRSAGIGELLSELESADVVFASTGASSPLIDVDDVTSIMEGRADRPLLIVDIAMPRDVSPDVGNIDGVTILDMDDLGEFLDGTTAKRRQEVGPVAEIVEMELQRYKSGVVAREAAPVITALRANAEQIRDTEIARYRNRLASLNTRELETVESLTNAIVSKLLHEPTIRLKEASGSPGSDRLTEAVQFLFDLRS